MATVTEILDRAARLTGLQTTGTERALALAALQNVYRRAVLDSECDPQYYAYTFTSVADTYSLSTVVGEAPVRLLHVSLRSSGSSMNLDQCSMQELMDYRATEDTQGLPCLYATVGTDRIAFYPSPQAGDILRTWYLDDTPTLIESSPGAGQESTPSKIPVHFHWDVLLPGTIVEMLDKDQRQKDVEFWMQRHERGMQKLIDHVGQMGGEANRAYVAIGNRRPWLRDERKRW